MLWFHIIPLNNIGKNAILQSLKDDESEDKEVKKLFNNIYKLNIQKDGSLKFGVNNLKLRLLKAVGGGVVPKTEDFIKTIQEILMPAKINTDYTIKIR
jgi:hypothetical protein